MFQLNDDNIREINGGYSYSCATRAGIADFYVSKYMHCTSEQSTAIAGVLTRLGFKTGSSSMHDHINDFIVSTMNDCEGFGDAFMAAASDGTASDKLSRTTAMVSGCLADTTIEAEVTPE